jgi:hypothetical protein
VFLVRQEVDAWLGEGPNARRCSSRIANLTRLMGVFNLRMDPVQRLSLPRLRRLLLVWLKDDLSVNISHAACFINSLFLQRFSSVCCNARLLISGATFLRGIVSLVYLRVPRRSITVFAFSLITRPRFQALTFYQALHLNLLIEKDSRYPKTIFVWILYQLDQNGHLSLLRGVRHLPSREPDGQLRPCTHPHGHH